MHHYYLGKCYTTMQGSNKASTSSSPSLPGTVGTPAFFMVSLAVDLSPMVLILWGCTLIEVR